MENLTLTELKPYSQEFINSTNSGWGCGYVLIPKNHPILVKLLFENDAYFYLQIPGFSEEITLSEWEPNGEFYRIGFDTAHRWNNIENSSLGFVEFKTNELKRLVDSYTILDAKKEVENYFNHQKEKFAKYL